MSREKQIEEMAKCCTYYHNGECCADATEICDCDLMCEMFGVFANLDNAGYRKQEWISVDERLPKELTYVIVCDEDGSVGEAFCYKEGRFEWTDSEEIAFVTHWMPLPEAPKMKCGAE